MAGTPASVPGAAGVAGGAGPARARLQAIQGQLADARSRGDTESHPDVVALKSQLASAAAAARGEPLTGGSAGGSGVPNPLYLSLQSMMADKQAAVAALKMRKAQLQGDLDQLNQKLAGDPAAAAEQSQIDRQYDALKQQYDQLLAQRSQVAMHGEAQSQTDTMKFNVIDPPTAPRAPVAPNRFLLLTGVLIAALAAGIGAAFLMGQLRATYPTKERLEKASGMPVIGSIGEVVTRAQSEDRAKKLKLFLGGTAALGIAYMLLLGVEVLQRGLAA
jgi:uncharacterized protein involved in exopolysaccharide biosynthesis